MRLAVGLGAVVGVGVAEGEGDTAVGGGDAGLATSAVGDGRVEKPCDRPAVGVLGTDGGVLSTLTVDAGLGTAEVVSWPGVGDAGFVSVGTAVADAGPPALIAAPAGETAVAVGRGAPAVQAEAAIDAASQAPHSMGRKGGTRSSPSHLARGVCILLTPGSPGKGPVGSVLEVIAELLVLG